MSSNKNNRPIAFFDSGVGGLTVLKEVYKLLPAENYVYFGDTKNVPYGGKTRDELIKITDKVFEFLISKDVKAVVMACNTTSAVAYDFIKDKYPVKVYPIIQSCAKIIAQMPIKKVGVFATNATINSEAYAREINKYNNSIEVFSQSCPDWVKIVEEHRQNEKQSEEIVKKELDKMLKNNVEKIILGCTHYPFLLELLEKFAPREMFIDPAPYFAEFIAQDLDKYEGQNAATMEFYTSADPTNFQKAGKLFFEIKQLPELVKM